MSSPRRIPLGPGANHMPAPQATTTTTTAGTKGRTARAGTEIAQGTGREIDRGVDRTPTPIPTSTYLDRPRPRPNGTTKPNSR